MTLMSSSIYPWLGWAGWAGWAGWSTTSFGPRASAQKLGSLVRWGRDTSRLMTQRVRRYSCSGRPCFLIEPHFFLWCPHSPRSTKISDHVSRRNLIQIHQDVVRLEVAMKDRRIMDMSKTLGDLAHGCLSYRLAQTTLWATLQNSAKI